MAERYLEIKNFRNVGLTTPQRLILGTSLKKDNIGGVVYVVGPNNSGKSNCLDALEKYSLNTINKSDVPDFDDNDPTPQLRFVAWEDNLTFEQIKTPKMQSIDTGIDLIGITDKEKDMLKKNEISDSAKTFAINLLESFNKLGYSNNSNLSKQARLSLNQYTQNTQKIPTSREFWDEIQIFLSGPAGRNFYLNYCNVNEVIAKKNIEELVGTNIEDKIIRYYEEKYGYKLIPNILRFQNIELSQKQFNVDINKVKESTFMLNLLESIDYNIDNLINSYTKYMEKRVRAKLEFTQNEINHKLEKVAERFNKLYLFEKNKYIFKIYLDTNQISFSILLNQLPLNFDSQSTGFKWFFNFYFTLLSQKSISPGDIIIMDEPATNLHVLGIQELRDFIKDYSRKMNLVFVISTHSPFFIDVDNLENVRVVNREDNEAIISNKFNVIDNNDTDSLGPIKSALTVGRHILLDPTKKTIFVEGLTDYCYLSYFKKYNKVAKDTVFLPIQGVIKSDLKLFEQLLKIDRYPTLLVDGDYAGLECQKKALTKYKGKIEVLSLKDIDSSFTKIEDLFDSKDCPKSKDFDSCVDFKSSTQYSKLAEKTKSNFTLLFDNICS